jgi:hypothetical protein
MTNQPVRKRSLWIATGIAIKFLLYGLFLYLQAVNYDHTPLASDGTWRLYAPAFDTKSYVLPVENLLATGRYIEDAAESLSMVIRMPGYGGVYLLLRLVTNGETALNLLVLLQVIVSGTAAYFLALISYRLTGKALVFCITFFLYAFSAFVSMYDMYILTESLSTNCVIFSLYFTLFAFQLPGGGEGRIRYGNLVAAGALLALAAFMRPVAACLFVPYAGFVLYTIWAAGKPEKNAPFARAKGAVAALAALGGVFVLGEVAWIARNYAALGRFIPAQYNSWAHATTEPEKNVEYYAFRWIRAVGGDCVFYEPNSLAAWLFANEFCGKDFQLPANIYGAAYDREALLQLRERFLTYKAKFGLFSSALHIYDRASVARIDSAAMQREAIDLNNTFDAYTKSYISTHPVDYYFTNRVRLVRPFLVHSGVGVMPFKSFSALMQEKSFVQLSLKVLWALMYWGVLAGGMAGLLYFLVKPSPPLVLIASCIVGSIVIFPFFVQIVDSRFLCLAYPFLTLAAGVVTGTAFTGSSAALGRKLPGKGRRRLKQFIDTHSSDERMWTKVPQGSNRPSLFE